MITSSATIVQRLWNYCNVLRDDGMSYGDYVEQLTYLLFLKMADEQERAGHFRRLAEYQRKPPVVLADDWTYHACMKGAVRSGEQAALVFGTAPSIPCLSTLAWPRVALLQIIDWLGDKTGIRLQAWMARPERLTPFLGLE
jgi:HsdM N-terminal domain